MFSTSSSRLWVDELSLLLETSQAEKKIWHGCAPFVSRGKLSFVHAFIACMKHIRDCCAYVHGIVPIVPLNICPCPKNPLKVAYGFTTVNGPQRPAIPTRVCWSGECETSRSGEKQGGGASRAGWAETFQNGIEWNNMCLFVFKRHIYHYVFKFYQRSPIILVWFQVL